jgi:ribosomal protein S14
MLNVKVDRRDPRISTSRSPVRSDGRSRDRGDLSTFSSARNSTRSPVAGSRPIAWRPSSAQRDSGASTGPNSRSLAGWPFSSGHSISVVRPARVTLSAVTRTTRQRRSSRACYATSTTSVVLRDRALSRRRVRVVASGSLWCLQPARGTGRGRSDAPTLDGTGVNQHFIRTASTPCGVAVYQGHIYWGRTRAASRTRARR